MVGTVRKSVSGDDILLDRRIVHQDAQGRIVGVAEMRPGIRHSDFVRLGRMPGQRKLHSEALAGTGIAVEGFLIAYGIDNPVAVEIVVGCQIEYRDIVLQRFAESATGADLDAVGKRRDQMRVETAEAVGILRELLGRGREKALSPACVQRQLRKHGIAQSHSRRRAREVGVAREIAAHLHQIGDRVADTVVTQRRHDAHRLPEIELVEGEDAD